MRTMTDLNRSVDGINYCGYADLGVFTASRRTASQSFSRQSSIQEQGADTLKSSSSASTIADTTCCSYGGGGKRTIIIEPALCLMFSFIVATLPLRSQYVYHAIGEQYNLSAITASSNSSSSSGGLVSQDCSNEDTNSSLYRLQQRVQAESAEFNLVLDLTADLPGMVVTLFMGPLSDNYGRKPALILPLIGVLGQCAVYVTQQIANLSLYVMIAGGVLNALSGGPAVFVNACYAYYADTIASSELGRRVIMADLVYGLVLALMQVAMGYLIQMLGYTYPYIIIMTGHTVNLLYVIFFVPESKPRASAADRKPISPKLILNSFKVMFKPRPGRGRLVLLLGIAGRCTIVFFVWPRRNIQTLFLLNSPLCWSSTLIGIVSAFSSIYGNLCQLLMTLILLPRLREGGCLLLSVSCAMASTLWFGLSSATWMVFLVPVIGFTQGACLPILRAMLSVVVRPEEQGALFASLSTTTTAIDLVGGIAFSVMYANTLLVFKGTTFVVMAAGLGIAVVILYFFRREYIRKAERDSWRYKVPPTNIYAIT